MAKRKRRAFTLEFKEQTVRIVRESGTPIATVAVTPAMEAGVNDHVWRWRKSRRLAE